MQVKRDFSRIYQAEEDPWAIGAADAPRYDLYRELLLEHARERGRLLDIGCGLGAFLGRFENDFDELVGVDVSADAVAKASSRRSRIRFLQGSAPQLEDTAIDDERFDAIVFSDVVNYFPERAKRRALAWVANHLSPRGVALIAAWSPGGKYLKPAEFRSLVRKDLRIRRETVLDSEHVAFVAERKRRLVALTFDYETWQPIPEGRRIDWNEDVFRPAADLLDAAEREGVQLTFFAEVGELLWLDENEPKIARRMEEQWQNAVRRGHDVQLHLHPAWLPELGARRDGETWWWDRDRFRAHDYPGDLTELIGRCKRRLEDAVRPAHPAYRVTCFRAGAYQAQPFRRLRDALVANGIECDSSVYAGGVSTERGYDYSLAWSRSAPYWASRTDPQLLAPPAERSIIELPIYTSAAGKRLLLDGNEAATFARVLIGAARQLGPTSEALRRAAHRRALVMRGYSTLGRARRFANRILPRRLVYAMTSYGPDDSTGHQYAIAIGHTKGDLDVDAIMAGARQLREAGFEVVTLEELGQVARAELTPILRTADEEVHFQVERERSAVLGWTRNERQSFRLQDMIPLDREHVLDLGCGAGDWSARIAARYPWMTVVGVDAGVEFIDAARERHPEPRVSFVVGDFTSLPFDDGTFDCIYADNSLEHAYDIDGTLAEARRVLRTGGTLVAAIPSDARNPQAVCDNHAWKTAPHDVRLRLADAGFTNVEVDEVDVFRRLGMPPFPPAKDRMSYVRAWQRDRPVTELQRAEEAMRWVYRRLEPDRSHDADDAISILAGGHALCTGYAVALGRLLEREQYGVRWLTMLAKDHPRGRGEEMIDAHEVLAVTLDGREVVLDPMACTVIPYAAEELLARPELAQPKAATDERYRLRGYELYDTQFWYERVFRYRAPRTPAPRMTRWRRRHATR